MIVPQFWAESRCQHRSRERRLTVRRFGWSATSQADAQAHADARAQEALQRMLAGESLPQRDRKVPYNGAEGVPIREEIVDRYGNTVITRNAYGARCLNTPDVLFADVDFTDNPTGRFWLFALLVSLALGALLMWLTGSWLAGLATMVANLAWLALIGWVVRRLWQRMRGGREGLARARIDNFARRHPDWGLRLYRTPAGLRVLVTHRTFAPDDPAVAALFSALRVDPLYARMCRNQRCFRARLSGKPWRMGLSGHMRPRPGVWPVAPELLPLRQAWVADYERIAAGYSACRFVESRGPASIHHAVREVMALHDEFSGALANRPLA
jgi:hypothetical protein